MCSDHEVDTVMPIIVSACDSVCAPQGARFDMKYLDCSVGSAIETPRACIRADRITGAHNNSFLSVGTNELTSLIFGLSKDDAQPFMV